MAERARAEHLLAYIIPVSAALPHDKFPVLLHGRLKACIALPSKVCHTAIQGSTAWQMFLFPPT
jgi:hypothetical protein